MSLQDHIKKKLAANEARQLNNKQRKLSAVREVQPYINELLQTGLSLEADRAVFNFNSAHTIDRKFIDGIQCIIDLNRSQGDYPRAERAEYLRNIWQKLKTSEGVYLKLPQDNLLKSAAEEAGPDATDEDRLAVFNKLYVIHKVNSLNPAELDLITSEAYQATMGLKLSQEDREEIDKIKQDLYAKQEEERAKRSKANRPQYSETMLDALRRRMKQREEDLLKLDQSADTDVEESGFTMADLVNSPETPIPEGPSRPASKLEELKTKVTLFLTNRPRNFEVFKIEDGIDEDKLRRFVGQIKKDYGKQVSVVIDEKVVTLTIIINAT